MSEDFRTVYCDPGEDFGWCIGRGFKLLAAGTTKMWPTAHELKACIAAPDDPNAGFFNDPFFARDGVSDDEVLGPIGRIVCEDWRLYPEKLHALKWDRCRTARVIGAVTFIAQEFGIPLVLQPASIKKTAQAAGAEELYYRPIRENRHQNDAIQHFVFFTNTELRGVTVKVPDNAQEGGDAD